VLDEEADLEERERKKPVSSSNTYQNSELSRRPKIVKGGDQ